MVQSLPQSDGSRILFNSPELSEVQRSGFHLFLKKGIAEELSKISCIQLKDVHFLIEIVIDAKDFRLVTPENNYRDCILKMKSYTCKLYVQTKILFKDKVSGELVYQTQPEWVLLADLPMMTKRGHFVINGSPRVIVHQVGRAPGVYFKKVLKVKKDVNNKARFYGDIIPRKGVWVRLQINKKGEIDLKLKKSKKVRAEMVQKCLELLEKERSKPILSDRHKVMTNQKQETQNYLPVSGYRFKLSIDKSSLNLQDHPAMLKGYAVAPLVQASKQDWSTKPVYAKRSFALKREPFYHCNISFKSNHTKSSSAFTEEQLFFSVKNLYLAGIDRNHCIYSQTRQTQAFTIGFSTNKPKRVTSSIWYHAKPWLTMIRESSTQVKRVLPFNTFISIQAPLFFSKDTLFCPPARSFFTAYLPKSPFGGKANKNSDNNKKFVFLRSKKLYQPSLHMLISRTESTSKQTQLVHNPNRAKRLELLCNKRLANKSVSFYPKRHNHHSISISQEQGIGLVERSRLPLGATMYGKKRSGFTKAEKEAFTNVYTSFYKNSIQDIKERAFMSFGKRVQDLRKPDSLHSNLLSVTRVATQSKSGVKTSFLQTASKKVEKKRIVKKQNVSIHLEKVRDYLYQLFKRSDLYDLGTVGREKINTKFGISVTEPQLTALDIKETINWLSKLRAGKEEIDDIDHSQNRRVRTSSELIQTQFEIGIIRLKNVITKKVRNGRIEQIKTLPALLQTKDLQEQQMQVAENVSVHKDLKGLENESRKTTTFSGLHFKGGGSCFVRRNSFIDKIKYDLQNRTTFTSINPYCVTHQKKKKYYSTLVACKANVKAKLMQKRSDTKVCISSSGKDTQSIYTFRNGFFTSNQIKKDVSIDMTTKDAFNPQSHQLSDFSVSELFSTKPINGALREFFSSSPLSQYMDQTNPLAEITHKRRISSLGVGGVSRESAGMAIRGIHPTHYGRICPIETPEGKNAGLVNSLAFYAKINNQGFIETPYYQVIKGQIQHELGFSFVSAGQESQNGLYIAPNDIKQSKSKLLAANISTLESIPVRVADTILDLFKKVSPYQVDCIGISPVQILSVATSLIPFLEHNDANRALMGSNMQRQAVSLMISERPLVGTGLEARVLAESGHLVQSKVSGFISSVSAHKVVVERLSNNLIVVPTLAPSSCLMDVSQTLDKGIFKRSFNPFLQHARTQHSVVNLDYLQSYALYISQRISSVRAQKDIKRNVCVQTKTKLYVQSKAFATALHARTCKLRCKASRAKLRLASTHRVLTLLETKDSQKPLSVSSLSTCYAKPRFARKTKQWSVKEQCKTKFCITSLENDKPLSYLSVFRSEQSNGVTETFVTSKQTNTSLPFSFTKKRFAFLPVTHSISTFSRSNQETCLVQKPLVEEGDWVQKGDMLSDCSAGQKGELSVGKNMLIAYIPWQGYNFEDAIVISDRLVKEQLYTSLHIERYTVIVNDFKDKVVDTNEWFTGNLPGVDIKKRNHLQKSGLPIIGTILREGDILVGKIKYSKKKPATPHEKLVCDILGEHNFSVQNSSLYVPKGVHEARVLTYKVKKRFEKALKNNYRPAGAPKVVHIFLGEKRNIQVGDKMSGRHGNKGIVSTILPKQDMPYLADGSPIDILLNPLGVPSRMNVGQVFECLLGLASTYLHQNFKVTSFDELYGVEASQSLVFLKLYQARLQSGQNWLFQVNFPGKTRLTDGRSGECLDQWITVGRAYMLKLIHMVNEKIHARAIGPYALVTQQPLKGRAHKGGQRLGEMEVWAVEGFGAAYILQELLTKKSDDSIGRKEVLKAMLPRSASFLDFFDPFGQSIQTDTRFGSNNLSKKDNRLYNEDEAFNVLGQPDIFKVLICELQALCLDVGVYSMRTESFQRQFLGILE